MPSPTPPGPEKALELEGMPASVREALEEVAAAVEALNQDQAAAITEQLGARWIVPMHYRTERISFLETAEPFLERMPNVERLTTPSFETEELPAKTPLAVVPAAP